MGAKEPISIKQPKSLKELEASRAIVAARYPVQHMPPGKTPPLDVPDILFGKGLNKKWKNTLYSKIDELGLIKPDEIKMPDGKWREIDAKKLINRLVSNQHGQKMLGEAPRGYKTMLGYMLKHSSLLRYVGKHTLADLRREHPKLKLPEMLDLKDKSK